MAVAIQNLNGDASFLLTFEPVDDGRESSTFGTAKPFRVLMDPHLPESSLSTASVLDIPEPDVIIITQHKTDHCNEATLRQLPAAGTKTIILADSSSARAIRSWKHFEKGRIFTIPEWETPHPGSQPAVLRVGVPPLGYGEPGEITVSLIPQKHHSFSGLHNAIGITYRPSVTRLPFSTRRSLLRPHSSHNHLRRAYITTPSPLTSSHTTADLSGLPPAPSTTATTSTSYRSLCSVRSALSLRSTARKGSSLPQPSHDRPLSLIFSPHGIHYSSLHTYITSHLISEAALPLTALVHPFDTVEQPWWLGGNVLLGAPTGAEIATRLGAKAWISAHDPNSTCSVASKKFSKRTKRQANDVVKLINAVEGDGNPCSNTEVFCLAAGEEVVLTREAVFNPEFIYQDLVNSHPSPLAEQKKKQNITHPSPPVTPTKTKSDIVAKHHHQPDRETPPPPPALLAVSPSTKSPDIITHHHHHHHPEPPETPTSIITTTTTTTTTPSTRSGNSPTSSQSDDKPSMSVTTPAHKSTPPPRPPRPSVSLGVIPIRPLTTAGHDDVRYNYTSFANLEEVMFRDNNNNNNNLNNKTPPRTAIATNKQEEEEVHHHNMI
ncbi:hypothetical protein QBC43DRAFT_371751 [Cladorrhinum sp. PSN259]|nr:hypothetical protein QBC43DRAFT_371751 [Cladorrhinum sp. PSN259]